MFINYPLKFFATLIATGIRSIIASTITKRISAYIFIPTEPISKSGCIWPPIWNASSVAKLNV